MCHSLVKYSQYNAPIYLDKSEVSKPLRGGDGGGVGGRWGSRRNGGTGTGNWDWYVK